MREVAKSDYLISHGCLSVRVEQLGSHWIFVKYDIRFFENQSRKLK